MNRVQLTFQINFASFIYLAMLIETGILIVGGVVLGSGSVLAFVDQLFRRQSEQELKEEDVQGHELSSTQSVYRPPRIRSVRRVPYFFSLWQ